MVLKLETRGNYSEMFTVLKCLSLQLRLSFQLAVRLRGTREDPSGRGNLRLLEIIF